MTAISKSTAIDIALAYREVETAEKLLADIVESMERRETPDIRDAFGRHQDGLQLAVPSSQTSRTLFHVPWTMAKPIIEAHIAHHRTRIELLTAKAREEMGAP